MGVIDEVRGLRMRAPKALGGMTPKPDPELRVLLAAYAEENLGDPDSYPASWHAFRYVARALSIAALGRAYPAVPTSGGTESNILALYAAREAGARKVVAPATAHYSIDKAARLLGLRVVRIPADPEPDLDAAARELEPGSVLVATVGTTETGYVDPVREMARLAEERGALLHVDAAFAGPVARYTAPPGRLPERLGGGVRWMGVDAHKIIDAPFQAGVLITASHNDAEALWFNAAYTPSGRQPGLLGSRAGAPFVAAARAVERVEETGGFEALAARLMGLVKLIEAELVEQGPFREPHRPMTPVLCLIHERHQRLVRELRAMGYNPYTCPRLGGVRLALTSAWGEQEAWEAIEALRRASSRVG